MRTAPISQATDLNTASGDTLSPLLAHLKHFILGRSGAVTSLICRNAKYAY